jgi:hypothetical protein
MTNTIQESPWHHLPIEPSYILPEDLAVIAHHRNYSNLRLDMMPGQFIGGLDNAEVVFLLLNPGFNEGDITTDLQLPGFADDIHGNHTDPYGSAFYVFNKGYEHTEIYKWWTRILNPLVEVGVDIPTLRTKVMTIEYFPYHSVSYKNLPLVPSQQVAFDLVNEAIERGKIIVIMRSKDLWYGAIPALEDYENKMIIKNPRAPYVSPNNLGETNFNIIMNRIIGEQR